MTQQLIDPLLKISRLDKKIDDNIPDAPLDEINVNNPEISGAVLNRSNTL